MMDALAKWIPPALGALILYLGLSAFLDGYPRAGSAVAGAARPAGRLDSALQAMAGAIRSQVADTLVPEEDLRSPFGDIAALADRPKSGHKAPPAPPPPRNYKLRGTVGDQVATLTNNSGQKLIVRVGDKVDSATVITIAPNQVEMRDRGGKFTLSLEP